MAVCTAWGLPASTVAGGGVTKWVSGSLTP
jgi:hypothetical protein